MSFLNEWITNIILFILIAIIVDLLLPNSSMQKYVKTVIGLLLVVIILTPLFQIFSLDIDQTIKALQISPTKQEKNIENLIEMKKSEIQASQRAYILEQMAVQMKLKVEEEMVLKYGLTIQNINLKIPNAEVDENLDLTKDVSSIEVTLSTNTEKNETIPVVETVTIDTSMPIPKKTESHLEKEVVKYLASKWEVDPEMITVMMEGGRE